MMGAWIVILVLCVFGSAKASNDADDIELDRINPKNSKTLYKNKFRGYANETDRRTRTSSHIIYQNNPTFPNVYSLIEFFSVESLRKVQRDFSNFSLPFVLSGQAKVDKVKRKVYTYDEAEFKSTLPFDYFRALYRKACALLGMNKPSRDTLGLSVNTKEGLCILRRIVNYKILQEEIERTNCDNFRQLQIGAQMTLLEAEVKRAEALSGLDREYLVAIGEGLDLVESIDILTKFSTNDMPNDILLSNYSRSYKHLQEKAKSGIRKIKLHYHETMAKISEECGDVTLKAVQDKIIQLAKSPNCDNLSNSFIQQICDLLAQRIEMLEKNLEFICEVNRMKPKDVIEYILESDYREDLKEDPFYQFFIDDYYSPRSESSEDIVHSPLLNFLSYKHLLTEGLLEEFTPLEAKIVLHRKSKDNQISDGDACNDEACDASSCDAKRAD